MVWPKTVGFHQWKQVLAVLKHKKSSMKPPTTMTCFDIVLKDPLCMLKQQQKAEGDNFFNKWWRSNQKMKSSCKQITYSLFKWRSTIRKCTRHESLKLFISLRQSWICSSLKLFIITCWCCVRPFSSKDMKQPDN